MKTRRARLVPTLAAMAGSALSGACSNKYVVEERPLDLGIAPQSQRLSDQTAQASLMPKKVDVGFGIKIFGINFGGVTQSDLSLTD